ncbi:MAG: FlgO family outer membrane protein [bacterium]|jgi:TolB-like protein|nr:FlgO family outer membrane protein [candidate division KSB1 bacterium]MDH7560789.1 FlgO family outer membrane protein [bacterium]
MKRRVAFAALAGTVSVLLLVDLHAAPTPQWHADYVQGLQAAQEGRLQEAVQLFQQALKVRAKDSAKQRAQGTTFIEYYPHRELGICYYYLGDLENARRELNISLSQAPTPRARRFLDLVNRGQAPPKGEVPPFDEQPPPLGKEPPAKPTEREPTGPTAVGERLSIAVLPFASKGIGRELGQIDLLDKVITELVNLNRFKVIERAQLEKILAEQQLGMSGVLDASTAAQIGKGIGVDAVMIGSITQGGNSVTIDARLIDTETATIISAKDAFVTGISLQSLSQMISELAGKFRDDFPLANGYVIGIDGSRVTLDLSSSSGLKKGRKCIIYREGAPIVHPVSGKVIGRMIDELCEVQVTDVFESYSLATVTKTKAGAPALRDRVITK